MKPRATDDSVTKIPERLHALLARADDGVWVTATDGRIVFWNRAAEAILGHRGRDVIGRRCADVITGRDPEGRPLCGRGCDGTPGLDGIARMFGVPTCTKRDEPVWLEVTALASGGGGANGNGSAPLIVHVFADATRTRQFVRSVRDELEPPAASEARLTPREADVLRLVAQGIGTAALAERLRVSRATVRNHIQNIFAKLRVHTRLEAVVHARARDLL